MEITTEKTGFDQKGRKRVTGDGYDITLFEINGKYFASESKCPHRGGPLFLSKLLENNRIMCPSHHIEFDLMNGKVVHNPIPVSMGEYALCTELRVLEIQEKDRDLIIKF